MTLVADYNFAPGLFHITFICVSGEIVRKSSLILIFAALSEKLASQNTARRGCCPAIFLITVSDYYFH